MRWGFRVATDRRFGAGHVTRSRALAVALDWDAVLFCDPDDGGRLDWPSRVFRETTLADATFAIAALRDQTIQALVVDSYAVDNAAIDKAAREGFVVAFRDALPYGPEAMSINPNPGCGGSKVVLAGPAYMPLPLKLARVNENARRATKAQTKALMVLVAFGARDSVNRTMTALEGLAALSRRLQAQVAIGSDAMHADLVAAAARQLDFVEILPKSDDLTPMYERFDFAIGAPGVSQFERACCGIPTVLVPQSDRQEFLARAWAATGAALCCAPDSEAVSEAVVSLLDAPKTISEMRELGLHLVDGKGATRVADALRQKAARL